MGELGQVLASTLVAVLILGVAMTALTSFGKILGEQQIQSNSTFVADQIRRNLRQYLSNDEARKKTVTDSTNANLACLRNHTSCSGKSGKFFIKDASDTLAYDSTSAGNGFDSPCKPCDDFDATNGNDQCPYRMSLTWAPVCGVTDRRGNKVPTYPEE